jgi:hypothetical protein
MNCANVDTRLSDYIDEELAFAEMAAIRDHLAGCSYCKAKYDDLMDALRDLRATEPVQAPKDFETTVLTRTRLVAAQPGPIPSRRPIVVPIWVPIAAAAALLLVFIPIIMVMTGQVTKHTDEISKLENQIKDLSKRPIASAPSKPAPSVDPAYIISEFVRDLGLVPYEETVVPYSIHDHILKGHWYVNGQWMPRDQAMKTIEGPRPPEPPKVNESEVAKNWLEANNYVRIGDVYVPANYKELVKAGKLPVDRNEPTVAIDRAKFEEDFMKENDLVKFEGRVMSRTQMTELTTARTIDPPGKILTHHSVTALLEGLKIGPPMCHQDVAIYPLLDDSKRSGAEYQVLRDAMGNNKIHVTEANQSFSIQIDNKGASPVLIPAGCIFSGGMFERMVKSDVMVAPGQKLTIPVYDTQPYKFSSKSRFGTESGRYIAPFAVCRAARQGYGQAAVWASTFEYSETLGVNKKDPSMDEIFGTLEDEIDAFQRKLGDFSKHHPAARGLAVAIGSQVVLVRVYANPDLLATQYPMILASIAADQTLQARGIVIASDVMNVTRELKTFIERTYLLPTQAGDYGMDLVRQSEIVGSLCLYKGSPVSLTLFAGDRGQRTLAELMNLTSRITGDKMDRIMQDYDSLVAGSGIHQKIALLKELSAIGAPQTTRSIVKFYYDKEFEVRKAAVNVTADRKDVAAVPDLIKLFDSVASKDAAMLDVVAKAMARIPDQRCAEHLVKSLRTVPPQNAGVVVDAVPTANVTDRKQLENTLVTLLGFWDYYYQLSLDPNSPIDAKTRLNVREAAIRASQAINGITGQNFTTPSEAKGWWSKNKEEFLRNR